jgi:hypothetical protein
MKLRDEAHRQVTMAQNQIDEIKKQTEIQQRPFVIFEPVDTGTNDIEALPSFRNIGNGIAFNIKLRGGRFKIQEIFGDCS